MIVHRHPGPVAAISLDLDNTLYANPPVLQAAEQAMWQTLATQVDITSLPERLALIKGQLARQQPRLANDVGRLRLASLQQLLTPLLPQAKARLLARRAMKAFLIRRQHIRLDNSIHHSLTLLARRLPLVAISNGNACVKRMAAKDYFCLSLRAGRDGRAKPAPDLFVAASCHLGIPLHLWLHVGDHPHDDIAAANRLGMHSVWTRQFIRATVFPGKWLPTATIDHLAELTQLL